MDYNMDVKEFLERSERGGIDYSDFIIKYLEKTNQLNNKFNFFSTLIDKIEPRNPRPSLFGLPLSIKDCICVKDMQSAAGSRILEGYKPPFDATCVDKIKKEGGAIIGKTNQDEFGFGTFSTNSGFDVPKNPLDSSRSCGGSSGGAAGIVAALGMPNISIAESTGGSISCPAAFCGVVGLTPTYGLVSRYGLIDYANSLDKIGLIAKSVWGIARGLSIIVGHDSKDSTSINKKTEDYEKGLDSDLKKVKIGVPKEYMENLDKKIEKIIWGSVKKLESLGVEYKEISLPHTKYSLAAYYIIAAAEASTNLAKFCGMRYGEEGEILESGNFNECFSGVRTKYFGTEAKRRILLGTYARMAGYRDQYYIKAMKVRSLVIKDFKKAFSEVELLAAPTMPVIAPKFSEIEKLTPLENYMMDILTVAPNLAGVPMLSVPCGKVDGMPVGLHIIGNHLQEKRILHVGHTFETG